MVSFDEEHVVLVQWEGQLSILKIAGGSFSLIESPAIVMTLSNFSAKVDLRLRPQLSCLWKGSRNSSLSSSSVMQNLIIVPV